MTHEPLSRRAALKTAARSVIVGAGANITATGTAFAATGKEVIATEFDNPVWNREAKARLDGDIAPGKQMYGTGQGVVCGVRPGERVRELLRFEIFSTNRVLKQPDGSYQRLNRELVFYRDVKTLQLLDQWDNPYSGERLRVVDVANDPFNYIISEFYPQPPSYGGLNAERSPKRPFLLKWTNVSDEIVGLEADIHLYYPSALKPEKWPRESPGVRTQASELFRFFMKRADLEDPAMTHVPFHGTWSRVTPWLPWMLMDQGPGHCLYVGTMGSHKRLDEYPPDVIARVKERYPRWLDAPTEWVEPSLSSLERYAKEQTPAPPKAAAKP